MITPKLALNFVSATLDPRITFTRAGATATRVNASGLIESVAADTARFDFDPTTLVCKGLLIEEQRQNVILNSANWTAGSWSSYTTGSATISITAASGTAPDGTNTATKVDFNVPVSDQAFMSSNVFSVTNGLSYAGSFYAKAATGADVGKQILFRHAGAGNYTIATLTANWVRYSSVEVAPATFTPELGIGLRPGVAGSSGAVSVLFWGAQEEAGAFVTSYIPTTSSAVTRNADVATITGSNFSSWWVAAQGGATANFRPSTVSGIRPIIQYDDGTANEIIALRGNTTNPELYIVDSGTPQAQIDAGTIAANTDYSLTGWWQTNDCRAKLGSGAQVIDNTATIPTVTQARIGSDGTNYLNGHIASISYYDSFTSQIYNRRKNKAIFSLM